MHVLSVVCEEPKKTVERHVTMPDWTPELIKRFYEESRRYPTIFGVEFVELKDFLSRFFYYDKDGTMHLYGPIWLVDDFVGVIYLDSVSPEDARAHFMFFDGRFKGRLNLIKAMMQHVFDEYKFRRLTVHVPTYAGKSVFRFVNACGFALEGKKRSAVKYKGKWFDVLMYGLLREELDHGSES